MARSLTVCTRAVPSTWTIAGILSFHAGLHVLRHQHERRVARPFEYLVGAFFEHDRRERPERLPVLHPLVQDVLHLGGARIGQDAAVAERARAELGAALEPADHVAFGQYLRRVGADVVAGRAVGDQTNQPAVGHVLHVFVLVCLAEIRVGHDVGTLFFLQRQMPVVCGADGDAVVAGRGLDPDVLESRLPRDAAVGDAVQADAAGDAEVLRAGRFAEPARPMQQHRLGVILDTPREVLPVLHGRALLPVLPAVADERLIELFAPVRNGEDRCP